MANPAHRFGKITALGFCERKRELSSSHCYHERRDSEDLHRAFHVVGKNVQAHLGTDAWNRLCQEMSCSHPGFNRAERVLGGLATYSRGLQSAIQSLLHFIEDILVLPACNAPIIASRALGFDRAPFSATDTPK
jgi:hypothetical protein